MESFYGEVPKRPALSNLARRFAEKIVGKSVIEVYNLASAGGTEGRMDLIREIAENGRDASTRELAREVIDYGQRLEKERRLAKDAEKGMHDPFVGQDFI
jgi:hypothetical protein